MFLRPQAAGHREQARSQKTEVRRQKSQQQRQKQQQTQNPNRRKARTIQPRVHGGATGDLAMGRCFNNSQGGSAAANGTAWFSRVEDHFQGEQDAGKLSAPPFLVLLITRACFKNTSRPLKGSRG